MTTNSGGAQESLITWNVPNWVTVVLMVTVGFFVLGAAGNALRSFGRDRASDEATA